MLMYSWNIFDESILETKQIQKLIYKNEIEMELDKYFCHAIFVDKLT